MILGFKVKYSAGGKVEFAPIGTTDTRICPDGSAIDAPPGTSGLYDSEVQISPDNRFLLVSLNGDESYTIPSLLNSSTIQSDSLKFYAIDKNLESWF